MPMGKFTALDLCPLTKPFSIEERSALAHFLEKRDLKDGDPVIVNRSKERALYIVDSGAIKVSFENMSLELKPGDSFGELSLIFPTQKLISGIAAKDSVLWMLTFDRWTEMRKVAPAISLRLLEAITQKLSVLLNNTVPPPRLFSSSVKTLG